jgi:putative endonuclease
MEKTYTYILECADGSLYTGWTLNLDERIQKHNNGTGAKYTRTRGPVKLVYFQEFDTRAKACKRECEIKSYTRKEKLLLIEHFKKNAT